MGASLTRLCFLYTLPHHTKAPSVSYTRARAIHRIRTLRYCLVCLSSSAFLSLFTSSSHSLSSSIHSQLANAALFSPFFSHNQNFPFIQTAAVAAYCSLPQLFRITLFFLLVTAPVPCRAPFLVGFFRSSVFTQQHELLLLQQPSHSNAHTLSSSNPSTFGGIRHHESRWTLPNCNSLTTNPASLCASSCTSSSNTVVVVAVVVVVATSSVLQRTSRAG